MKAIRVTAFGTPPAPADIPDPVPAKGELRVRVAACALNFADLLMIEGSYQDTPEPPFTLGMELAGVVEAIGPDTEGPAIGTRVAAFTGQGGLAEIACVPVARCIPLPDAVALEAAAAFPIAYGTSHLALTRRARLQPGERLVVLGAAGGVGLTAVELGAAMGAEVVAVARGPEKLSVAKEAGAHHLIDARDADLRDAIKSLGGADVVYDAVGGDGFTAAMRATNPEGRILVIGFASGEVPRIAANHLLVKNIDVMGFYWGGYMRVDPTALRDSLTELAGMIAEGRITPHIGATRPFDRAREALELLRSRAVAGKIVVTLDP